MAAPAAKTREELLARRQRVSELYLGGRTMSEIAAREGVSTVTIWHDLRWLCTEWRTKAIDAIEALKQRELARIDHNESEALKAWYRTIGRIVTRKVKSGTGARGFINVVSETIEHKAGDPHFLDIMLRCSKARCKLLGLDAPNKIGFGKEGAAEPVGEIRVVYVK